MKNTAKHPLFCLLVLSLGCAALCCRQPTAAQAQMNYYNAEEAATAPAKEADAPTPQEEAPPPPHSFTVTSIQKCYALIGREDALDIQRNFIKPYQECQRRLALKLKKEQKIKAGEAKDKPPEKPQGFFRVQKKPAPPPEGTDSTKNPGNGDPEDKALPEKNKFN